jgi:PAS domain S-box-containing protein
VRDVLGYEPEERIGSDGFALVHPDDVAFAKQQLAEGIAQPGVRRRFELRMRHKNGDWRSVELSGCNLLDAPNVGGLVLNYRDVTERERMTEALAAAARRLRLAMESAGMALWEWDCRQDRITWEEPRSPTSAPDPRPPAFPVDFASGMAMVHPDDRERVASSLNEALARGSHYELELRVVEPTDGQVRWLALSALIERAEDGSLRNVTGVVKDVTKRRLAQETLRESERKFAMMFHNNPGVMAITSLDGDRILDVNESAATLTGWQRDEILGRTTSEIGAWLDPVEREQIYSAIRASGTVRGREVRIRRKDGGSLTFVISAEPLDLGSQRCVLWSAIDVTETRKLSEQLLRAQKMDALGRLAGGVAHDFKNWLTPIVGYSELLLAQFSADDPRRREVEEIRNAGRRAADLATQLLRFSRGEMTQPRVTDLNELVAGMERLLRRIIGEDVELVTRLAPGLGRVRVDRSQIEQVILNLAVNARDAMPQGGRLFIETRNVSLEGSRSGVGPALSPGRYVVLAIGDTGCGMDADTQGVIFEPFFTTKEPGKGTGLGLSTAYGIVKQSGGDLTVRSEVGTGTTFEIYLPAVEGKQDADEQTPIPSELDGSETILLVEDQQAVRDFAASALRSYGYSVLAAESGAHALRLSAEFEGVIDLLVTDVVMPGMSGPELAIKLRVQRPGSRVVYLSGHTRASATVPGPLEPEAPFLHKPFTAVELARTVRRALEHD